MRSNVAGLALTLGILGCVLLSGAKGASPGVYAPSLADFRYSAQQQRYPETSHSNLRSLEIDDFKMNLAPTSGKVSSPTILKLYPSAGRATPQHVNLPLRFGRASSLDAVRMPKSSLNLPQRFGRSQEADKSLAVTCSRCTRSGGLGPPSATLPQRFGRTSGYRKTKPDGSVEIFARGFGQAPMSSRPLGYGYQFVFDNLEDVTDRPPEELQGYGFTLR